MTTRGRPGSVVVVGGAGAVGSMIAELFRGADVNVTVVDRVSPQDVSDSTHVVGDVTAPDAALDAVLAEADVVVLAVAEQVALESLPVLAELLPPETVLVETLSVKSRFAEAVHSSSLTCAAMGVNPMFAPSLGPAGRPVAAVTHRPGDGVDGVVRTFTDAGSSVVRLEATAHDRLTALTQALTHASILSFGLALADIDVDPGELLALGTPPHVLSLALLSRVAGGTPEVYWDVQAGNPYAEQARLALADAMTHLNETITAGDESAFARIMARAESALGTEAGALRTTCAEVFTGLGRRTEQ